MHHPGEAGVPNDPEVPVRLVDGAVSIEGRPVLRHVDLRVGTGEFVALMGANGSGKSTLVRALTGLRPLTSGDLELFGTPLARFASWQRIGFVPQRTGAASGVPASVWEVVASGRLTRRRLLRPLTRTDRAAIADALEVVGLADRAARRRLHALRRPAAARADRARPGRRARPARSSTSPPPGSTCPHQEALSRRCGALKGRGATIVLVAHELGPLAPLVDRAVVMRDGRMAYDGAPLGDHEVHDPAFGEIHSHHHTSHSTPAGTTTPRRSAPRSARRPGTARWPMSLQELFSLPFMQRALLAALFTGLAAPAIGTYLVQRRLALMGDGIGHVAVTGVAIGLATGTSPTWTAVVVAVLGAVLIEMIRERGHTNGDVALALLFYGGLAGGVLVTGLAGQSASALQRLPVRLDHHHLGRRRGGHHGAGGRGARVGARAGAPAVRGRPGPGVRPGRRAAACAPTTCWSRCWPRSASPSRCAPSACCWSRR